MNKGKEFEALVAFLERAVNNIPEVEVLHDVKMRTRYGGERQIDILIKENRGRFTYQTIVECKNTVSKVTVNTVGAFKELIESVGAHQGMIVSAAGFQSGALLSAKEANIHLYQLSQVEDLAKHLQEQRFIIYKLTHTSKAITIKFRETNELNDSIFLRTEMFAPMLNKKVTILDVAEDFLKKIRSQIADRLISKIKDPLSPQITKGITQFKINFPLPIVFGKGNLFTEIIGFDAEVDTSMFTASSELKNVSEYKDFVQQKTYALIYEVEYDGKTYKLLNTKK